MDKPIPAWREPLLARLERGMGRPMLGADGMCLVFSDADRTLTVRTPLLEELRTRNLISNVFRGKRA
jgi:hypothetical protein